MALIERTRAAAHARPRALIWLGMLMYSTGPVMVAASSVDGVEFSFMRLALGVPAIGLVALFFRGQGRGLFPPGARLWIVLAGVTFGSHQLFFMSAVKLTSVTDVVLMNTLSPVVVMILAVPMFAERTDGRFKLWTFTAILGAAIVAIGGSVGPEGNPPGMMMAAVNVLFFSFFYLSSKAARPHVDVWQFLFMAIVIAAAVVGGYFAITGRSLGRASTADWVLAACVAVGPGTLGHFFMTWPLARLRANVPPVIRLLQPIVAGGLAWLALGQLITWTQVSGGLITAIGVLGALGLFSLRRNRPN